MYLLHKGGRGEKKKRERPFYTRALITLLLYFPLGTRGNHVIVDSEHCCRGCKVWESSVRLSDIHTVLLPDLTANDGWCIVLQYLAFVHAGKSRHLIFIHENI